MASPSASTPAPRIRIGCAGWSIPSSHARLFGPEGSHLARYATRFDVVEINSTFYRAHRPQTFERWAATVPPGFRFSVKMPRQITHEARLVGTGAALDAFFAQIAGLGPTLGGVLVQLPPSLALDPSVAARFFGMLRRRYDGPVACEPRHASWFAPAAARLWERHAVTRVAADPPRPAAAADTAGPPAAGWRYRRWHGTPRIYYSRYDDAALRGLAAALQRDADAGHAAWCILDNTAAGHSVDDAARLQAMLADA
ncbi:DUF72 domain-containing protein [Coralloluteibacterium thermophilus]|uniref:DUF72 domain-containing protein n=1 Tax=Coralloluteibacterium thermophilum TaxID=2707049 RepID=A0ABV9NJW7_9GAMM